MMINCKLKYELKVVNLIHHLKLYIPCSPSMMEQPETHRKPAGQKDQISDISSSKLSLQSLDFFLQIDPDSGCQLPTNVDNFTQLCPLEPPPPSPMHKSQTFGYVTSVYKATNTKNGQCVVLRRIHGFRLVNTKCMVLVDQWKKLQHANLVALRQVFTTKAFHDHSMVFVYDFFPGAETLMLKHFNSPNQMAAGNAFMDPFK